MKAMILAAGFGTRLRPLTENRPKALIEVGGKPLLEWVIRKLIRAGFSSVIINVHHHAEMIENYLSAQNNFGIEIEISNEDQILGTGGGIKKAAHFLQAAPWFLVHNVDVLSTVSLSKLVQSHQENACLATLFVQQRSTSRYLFFDQQNLLIDRYSVERHGNIPTDNSGNFLRAFNGIHVISSQIFKYMSAQPSFSIIETYLTGVQKGERIFGLTDDSVYWRDVGRLTALSKINQELNADQILTSRLVNSENFVT